LVGTKIAHLKSYKNNNLSVFDVFKMKGIIDKH